MIILSDDPGCERTSCPIVNYFLILANVAVFFCMILNVGWLSDQFFVEHGFVPGRFLSVHDMVQFATIITAMFIHAGAFHIIGNMWALWLFGDNVEDKLGRVNYLFFYVTCGILAALAHCVSAPYSAVPCVGASGAIAGVMAAYMVLFPNATCKSWFGDDSILFGFRTFRIPAIFVIGGWFLIQVLATRVQLIDFNVAIYAHIGGFTAGLLLVFPLTRWRDQERSRRDEITGLSAQERMVRSRTMLPQSELQSGSTILIVCTSLVFVLMLAAESRPLFSKAKAAPPSEVTTPFPRKPLAVSNKHRVHPARNERRHHADAALAKHRSPTSLRS